jgi:hypothetical protein
MHAVPDDPAAPKYTEECAVKYEYVPDESWKATGTCTFTLPGGDKVYDTVEEGSHLKESVYLHREISRRERRRHVYLREPDRFALRRQIQRQARTALKTGKEKAGPFRGEETDRRMDARGCVLGELCLAAALLSRDQADFSPRPSVETE